jgi:hypothetical protein
MPMSGCRQRQASEQQLRRCVLRPHPSPAWGVPHTVGRPSTWSSLDSAADTSGLPSPSQKATARWRSSTSAGGDLGAASM